MATLLSPQENLCTGDAAFFLRIIAPADVAKATILLNGLPVHADGRINAVPEGEHELEIRRDGYEPYVIVLRFDADGRGDHRIDLGSVQWELAS